MHCRPRRLGESIAAVREAMRTAAALRRQATSIKRMRSSKSIKLRAEAAAAAEEEPGKSVQEKIADERKGRSGRLGERGIGCQGCSVADCVGDVVSRIVWVGGMGSSARAPFACLVCSRCGSIVPLFLPAPHIVSLCGCLSRPSVEREALVGRLALTRDDIRDKVPGCGGRYASYLFRKAYLHT